MTDVERLADLLLRWEEAYEQGQDLPTADLCRDCPDLALRLADQIRSLKALEWVMREPPDEPTRLDAPLGDPPRPQTLCGRYRLDKLLGEGGFGLVWQGFDLDLQRQIAIKLPHPRRLASGDSTGAFMEEARKIARLKHQGIVPVYDVGQEQGVVFIVCGLIDGGSLADRIVQGRLSHHEAARIVAEAADALAHAHQQGFVHRDLKPANIMLDPQGRVFVTDFGIAVGHDEPASEKTGTLAYMPPELVAGVACHDFRIDIYGLGVVLYQLLTGRLPFDADTQAELREKILSRSPERPRNLARTIPAKLESVCLKCLAKRPEDRFSSAGELSFALKVTPRSARPAWLIAAGLVVLVAVGLFFMMRNGAASPDDAKRGDGREPEEWVQLFNGTDLTGWKMFPGQPLDWKVEDGLLVGEGNEGISHLFSELGDYRQFRLHVEVRISDGGNSGVRFRAKFARDFFPGGFGGFEAQITSTPPDPWNRKVRTGSLVANENEVVARVEEMLVPPDTWFSQEVIVRRNRVMIRVNGETTADVQVRKLDAQGGYLALQRWFRITGLITSRISVSG